MNKVLLEYTFEFVDYINPLLDRLGNIKEYFPQTSYNNTKELNLNKYGEGSFCKFNIHPKWKYVS